MREIRFIGKFLSAVGKMQWRKWLLFLTPTVSTLLKCLSYPWWSGHSSSVSQVGWSGESHLDSGSSSNNQDQRPWCLPASILGVLPVSWLSHYCFFCLNVQCNKIEIDFVKSTFFLFSCSYIPMGIMKVRMTTGKALKARGEYKFLKLCFSLAHMKRVKPQENGLDLFLIFSLQKTPNHAGGIFTVKGQHYNRHTINICQIHKTCQTLCYVLY